MPMRPEDQASIDERFRPGSPEWFDAWMAECDAKEQAQARKADEHAAAQERSADSTSPEAASNQAKLEPHPHGSRRLIEVADSHITEIVEARPPAKEPKKKTSASTEAKFSRIYALVAAYRKKLGERGPNGVQRTHAANHTDYIERYNSSDWRMRQGIAMAKRELDYDRHVEPRLHRGKIRYMAVEAALPSCAGGYTPMPEWALNWALDRTQPGFDEKAFALAVVVRKSPVPMTLDEAARKLGVDDMRTKRRMMRQCVKEGLISSKKGPNGVNWVGRPGAKKGDFTMAIAAARGTLSKNHQDKNHQDKNRPKHYGRKEGTSGEASASPSDRKEGTKDDNNDSTIRSCGAERKATAQEVREWEQDYNDWLAPLADWRKTAKVEDRVGDERYGPGYFCTPGGERPSTAEAIEAPYSLWLEHVTCYDPHLPPRLLRKFAWELAIDLGREMVHRAAESIGKEITLPEAVIAIARYVANEWRSGNPVRSFGYFALNKMLDRIWAGDLGCVFDMPSKLPDDLVRNALRNAEGVAEIVAQRHETDLDRLTSTRGFERLHEMLLELGDGDIQKGWKILRAAIDKTPAQYVSIWDVFAPAAEAERRTREMETVA